MSASRRITCHKDLSKAARDINASLLQLLTAQQLTALLREHGFVTTVTRANYMGERAKGDGEACYDVDTWDGKYGSDSGVRLVVGLDKATNCFVFINFVRR